MINYSVLYKEVDNKVVLYYTVLDQLAKTSYLVYVYAVLHLIGNCCPNYSGLIDQYETVKPHHGVI